MPSTSAEPVLRASWTSGWFCTLPSQTMHRRASSSHYQRPLKSTGSLSLRIILKKKKEEMLDQRIYTLSVLTGAGFQNKSASSPRAAPGGLTDGGGLIASGCISELIQRMSFFSTQRPVTFLLSDGLFTTSNVTHKLVLLCICQGSAESHHSRDQIKWGPGTALDTPHL